MMFFPLLLSAATSLAADPPPPVYVVPRVRAVPVAAIAPAAATPPAPPLRPLFLPAYDDAAHALTPASQAGMSLELLIHAENRVLEEIQRGGFPGGALAIGRGEKIVVERGVGRITWSAAASAVDPDETIYDLASLTKVVGTTTAVMLLVQDGKMKLDAPVWRYLPQWHQGSKSLVTIRDLLTHTSGLPAWRDIWAPTPAEALARAIATPLERAPGTKAEYSDIGFVVLWAAAQSATAEPLPDLLQRRVFQPLGMHRTTFLPGEGCASCVPTHQRSDGSLIQGRVHDPIAYRLGGIAGNAGLFSTAHDLARFAAMLAGGGTLDGTRIFWPWTVRDFTARQPGADTRALGWDTPRADGGGAGGLRISPHAFGHTGFTGTSIWVDPDRGTWTVLLTNRTFNPKSRNRMQAVRRSINDWVALATDSGPLGSAIAPLLGTPAQQQ